MHYILLIDYQTIQKKQDFLVEKKGNYCILILHRRNAYTIYIYIYMCVCPLYCIFSFYDTSKCGTTQLGSTNLTIFFIRENPISRKACFVGSGEQVKPWLSQVLTIDTSNNSNSRPAVQISNPLPTCYGHTFISLLQFLCVYTYLQWSLRN